MTPPNRQELDRRAKRLAAAARATLASISRLELAARAALDSSNIDPAGRPERAPPAPRPHRRLTRG
jgi:hypothetical protein